MTSFIVASADDFCEENNQLELLQAIKKENPDFKITLFTIPGLCSSAFIEEMKKIDWIDLVPHGLFHRSSRECEHWSYEKTLDYLKVIEPLGLTKGFKAPGWQISDETYQALLGKGYWVADQQYNNQRRPAELRVAFPDPRYHFHIGHFGGHNANAIEYFTDYLSKLRGDFKFIKEIL